MDKRWRRILVAFALGVGLYLVGLVVLELVRTAYIDWLSAAVSFVALAGMALAGVAVLAAAWTLIRR